MLGTIRLADRVRFFRELATLVDAGMSLGMALSTLEERPAGGTDLRLATRHLAREVLKGKRLSDSMAAHPQVFTELNRALITAGEQGGRLDDMLRLSADYLERDLEFQQTVARETFYPKIMLAAVLFIPLVTKVAIAFLMGTGLSAITVLLQGLIQYTLFLGIPLLLLYLAVNRISATEQGRVTIDRLKLRIWPIGPVVSRMAWSRACRALAALYAAGVNIRNAVTLAAATAGNRSVEATLLATGPALERGKPLSETLGATGQIPPLVMSMVRTGEQTGNLDATLGKVADYFEAEASTSVKKMTVAIVPIAVLVFGVVVLIMAAQFYTGYFGPMLD